VRTGSALTLPAPTYCLACRLLTAVLLLAALLAILADPLRTGYDQATCLQVGDLLLRGYTLYVDVIDLNPPLAYYLHIVPAAVARRFEFHLVTTFLIGVWALTVCSVVATRRFLARAAGDEPPHADLAAMSIAVLSLFTMWRNDFGQREHLFVLGFIPYLALRFLRLEGRQVGPVPAILTGAAAALVACLKPHFVAIALAPELYLLAAGRSLVPLRHAEFVAFVTTGLAYGAHLLLLPDAMRTAWFGRWMPFIASGYRAFDAPWSLFIGLAKIWLPPAICSLAFIMIDRSERRFARFGRLVAIAALTAVVMYFVQHKGWLYHAIPAHALLAAMLALVAAEVNLRLPYKPICVALAVVLAGGLIAATALIIRPRAQAALARASGSEMGRALVSYSAPGDSVLLFSSGNALLYPLLIQLQREPGSRYMFSFPIPMIYYGVTRAPGRPFDYALADSRRRAEEAQFRAELDEDIRSRRPALVVVSKYCGWCPDGFSLRDYLSQTGFLEHSMGDYREADGFVHASVYVRQGSSKRALRP
jgi:hypothetical protein